MPLIILLSILVYILQEMTALRIGMRFAYSPVTYFMELNPQAVKSFQIWRFITYMFVHGGFWHLFINMWGLYLFGPLIEKHMGTSRFLILYFLSGIAGGFLWFIFNLNSYVPCVGASAALFGVMAGAAMLYPDMMIMLLIPPIPLKLKTFVIIYALIETFSSFFGIDAYVAHLAHLGGLIGGYFIIRKFYPMQTFNIFSFLRRKARMQNIGKGGHADRTAQTGNWTKVDVSAGKVDEILDKISKSGINSLTPEELDVLKKAREQMRRP